MVEMAREFLSHLRHSREMFAAYATMLRPVPALLPSTFAARYRLLKPGTTAQPGRWSNDYYPYLVGIMDVADEAIRVGKTGVVMMKSGQGGGSESMINVLAWLLEYFPGPTLYLISKDEVAKEFCRERFSYINETCEPLKKKTLSGRGSGELVHVKRYLDGKLVVQGGRSVLNLQSFAYRHVIIDEADSLQDELEGQDPIELAEVRTSTYVGNRRLMIVFAHPTTKERGAGQLYYQKSDQRRGFIACPHCGGEFWLQWEHVKAVASDGLNQAQADRDPRRYGYFAPCCGVELSDAQRWAAVRKVQYKSTLAPELAVAKTWIGVHFSQLYMPNIPLALLAEKWIGGLDDEPSRRVFYNKRLGDTFQSQVKAATPENWRRLICTKHGEDDLDFYERGQVPPGVAFLTAGQDSRALELHYSIWGWGLLRDEANYPLLCGWLIQYGVIDRSAGGRVPAIQLQTLDARELRIFDQLVYDATFPATAGDTRFHVHQCFHDSGWQPIAVYEYCRTRPYRAIPSKGGSEDSASRAPFIRWGVSPTWRAGAEEVRDPRLKLCILNTFVLKEDFYGLVDKTFKRSRVQGQPAEIYPRLRLPRDAGDDFIRQVSSEYKQLERKKYIWKHRGANHWADCTIQAYAAALNLDPFQMGLPFVEQQKAQPAAARPAPRLDQGGWKIGR